MTHGKTALLALLLALSVSACSEQPSTLHEPVPLGSPAGAGSSAPNLFAADDGTVYLSWLEPVDTAGSAAASTRRGTFALRFATLRDSTWSEPRTIAQGDDWFVNWADFPSLVQASNGDLVAHWLQRTGENTYAYAVRTARSRDGGAGWSAPVTPHRDGTPTEHGFVSLLPRAEGSVDALWLDGRKYAGADSHAAHGAAGPEMTLRHAVLATDGSASPEAELDARACDCCQTAAVRAGDALVVAYRDRSPDEIRDISVVRLVNGAWSAPRRAHADEWKIDACPVNGPALSARGERIALAWFTAARDTPKVLVAFSDDAGETFGAPVRVDGGSAAGRVDVELLDDGSALVLWLEQGAGAASILARRVRDGEAVGEPFAIAQSSGERASGFPRMALQGERVVFAWTEPGSPSHVRTAAARVR